MTERRDEFAVRRPHPELRHLVARYIGYRQHDVTLRLHRGLPSQHLTFLISLADPIKVIGGLGAERKPLAVRSALAGLHLGPALIQQDRYQHGIHVELDPLAARALFGISATELADTVRDSVDLPVSWSGNLADRLSEIPDWPTRFDVLDEQLRSALRPVTLVAEIAWAWRTMLADSGNLTVHKLAEEVGWSRRHFGSRFVSELGISPKQAARLMRFERSGELVRRGGYGNLAEVAVRCGYYDQAHMTNEWRVLAGCGPGTWLSEEVPFLQYDHHETNAD